MLEGAAIYLVADSLFFVDSIQPWRNHYYFLVVENLKDHEESFAELTNLFNIKIIWRSLFFSFEKNYMFVSIYLL